MLVYKILDFYVDSVYSCTRDADQPAREVSAAAGQPMRRASSSGQIARAYAVPRTESRRRGTAVVAAATLAALGTAHVAISLSRGSGSPGAGGHPFDALTEARGGADALVARGGADALVAVLGGNASAAAAVASATSDYDVVMVLDGAAAAAAAREQLEGRARVAVWPELLAGRGDRAIFGAWSEVVRAAAAVPGWLDDRGCTPGSCQEELYETNATSSEHRALARDLAADSVVMLKNEVLPLTTSTKIAVVGGACAAVHDAETLMKRWDLGDYYVVGGSGRVVAARITSVLDALHGANIIGVAGDDLDAARAAARDADVIVACGGAATTEAADRDSLRLDNHDFLTALVAGVDAPVVLVALAPGAIVLPQADAAAAALVCFLCG